MTKEDKLELKIDADWLREKTKSDEPEICEAGGLTFPDKPINPFAGCNGLTESDFDNIQLDTSELSKEEINKMIEHEKKKRSNRSIRSRKERVRRMILRPIHDKVVIKQRDAEKVSPGGIHIAGEHEKPSKGDVIAVGPGRYLGDVLIEPTVKEGDVVIFGKKCW